MIVRESPAKKRLADPEAWPPKSPHDAQISSPSRRRRLETDRDISLSPSKRRRMNYEQPCGPTSVLHDEQEDDEETLQLRLQEIQAKLRLKKLQNSRRDLDSRPQSRTEIEVELSPVRDRQPIPPESPRRVQLGIDKGLRANEVSLAKAASSKQGNWEDRIKAQQNIRPVQAPIKSFSERLASVRNDDAERQARLNRATNSRSKSFFAGLHEADARASPSTSTSKQSSGVRSVPPSKAAAMKLRDEEKPEKSFNDKVHADIDSISGISLSKRNLSDDKMREAISGKALYRLPKLLKAVTAPDYEVPDEEDFVIIAIIASKTDPYNHASKRNIASTADPDEKDQAQKSKFMVLHLTDLKWEIDLFLFDSGFEKFWKLTVGTVIAILNPAIMPPKPHMRDTGKFSLKIASSEETVLEVGTSKDLYWCKSLKKDGKPCGQWIDRRKTDFCDFHVNLQVERSQSSRADLNTVVGIGGFLNKPKSGKAAKHRRWEGRCDDKKRDRGGAYFDQEANERAYVMPKHLRVGETTSKMLDAEDYLHSGMSAREAAQKRHAARETERELAKQLSIKGSGMGAEYSRMRNADASAKPSQTAGNPEVEVEDAASLGLINGSATSIHLSPVKGHRAARPGSTATPMGWSNALKRGLPSPTKSFSTAKGDATKLDGPRKILKPNLSSQNRDQSSPSKTTRFALEKKGIRRPGRESMPSNDNNDDDDGLDII